jgi:hypothetical protein
LVRPKHPFVESKQPFIEAKQAFVEPKQAFIEAKQPLVGPKQPPVEPKQALSECKQAFRKPKEASSSLPDQEDNMATRPISTIAQQLNAAQVAISNSLADSEIQGLVADYGYSATKLNAGKALYDTAVTAVNAQKAKAGAQQDSSHSVARAEKAARDAYQALAKVARALFVKDTSQLAALGLNRREANDTAGFLAAAHTLFDNAASLPALANYGYDSAKLQAERSKITALDFANQQQEAAKGSAQQATREQDSALKALSEWTLQYLKIAKVALREKKQLLEKIGVTARTSKTAAQRAAPAKAAATRAARRGG